MSLPRCLELSDLEQAVQVQAQAFQDDPLWQTIIPSAVERQRYLPRFSRALYRFGILNRSAYGVGTPLQGVAIWTMPQTKTRWQAVVGAGFPRVLFTRYLFNFVRAAPIFARFEALQKQYAPDPHYYLNTIAVAPAAQGQGIASQLIRPFLARADAEGVSVYTETMTPRNVGLYEHYGFRCMEEYGIPQSALRLWSFYRAVTA